MRTISFLSDYGAKDEFVGVVKSVIRSIAPDAQITDITHGIPRHDIRAGSLALARASQYLNPGIVLAIVDPGVGSDRRGVAVELAASNPEGIHSVLIGPDNGLLAPAVALLGGAARAVSLTNTDLHIPSAGATFAGRDIFAPAAAHLCAGVPFEELGEEIPIASLMPAVVPSAQIQADQIVAEILWIDHFGNAQLNIGPDDISPLGERFALKILGLPEPDAMDPTFNLPGSPSLATAHGSSSRGNSRQTPSSRTATRPLVASLATSYDQIPPRNTGLVIDSYGMISIAMRQQPAAEELNLEEGMSVVLTPLTGDLVELTPRLQSHSE